MKRNVAVITLCAAVACSGRPVPGDTEGGDGDSAEAGSTALESASNTGPGSATLPSSTTSAGTTVGDTATAGGVSTDEGITFIEDPDGGSAMFDCDLHEQDCDRGFKCVPTTVDSSSWNGTACVPIVEDPQGLGDPCMLDDPATGADDCGWAQFCWNIDEMGVGECMGLCYLEDPDQDQDYSCEDPQAEPSIGCQSCFCVCVTPCNPLAQDCGEGQGCYAIGNDWECAPDASDGAGQDTPCEFINSCSAGHVCLSADAVPSCEGMGSGCCSAVCDTSLPDTCPGQALGMACTPWYEEGAAPDGLETVGVCADSP